jgi:hypothetical protein
MDVPWPSDHPRSGKERELQEAFAEQLRTAKERHIVWMELTLPDGGGRADVFAFRPWGSFRDQTVYEVKANRRAYWNDVNEGKYRKYLPYCHRLFFVVPAGLVKKAEVPEGCGLITRQPHGGFRVVVPAPRREIEEPPQDWLWGLLERTWFEDTRKVRDLKQRVTWEKNGELRPHTWLWGEKAAARIREAEHLLSAGALTTEAKNAIYLSEKMIELARAAGIQGRWMREELDESALNYLADAAINLLKATDRVQAIGRYLAHLNPHDGGRVDSYVLGRETGEVEESPEVL